MTGPTKKRNAKKQETSRNNSAESREPIDSSYSYNAPAQASSGSSLNHGNPTRDQSLQYNQNFQGYQSSVPTTSSSTYSTAGWTSNQTPSLQDTYSSMQSFGLAEGSSRNTTLETFQYGQGPWNSLGLGPPTGWQYGSFPQPPQQQSQPKQGDADNRYGSYNADSNTGNGSNDTGKSVKRRSDRGSSKTEGLRRK